MHWLKENWFKIAILLVLLICIGLIFLYVTRQQDIEKQAQLNGLNSDCQKLATQKKQELMNDSDPSEFLISTYEYKYDPTSEACILAYTANYFGALADFAGVYQFEVDNLTTGQTIMSQRIDPGNGYASTHTTFEKLEMQYIGSTTPAD